MFSDPKDWLLPVNIKQSASQEVAALLLYASRTKQATLKGFLRRFHPKSVKERLKNAQQVQATRFAFAAILGDGSIVSWGSRAFGGDSCAVQNQLKNVQQIQATESAFAAILRDGSVVSWGPVETLEEDELEEEEEAEDEELL